MENKLRITQNEISNIENFNLPLLQEAMRQVELKTKDENDRKLRIDQRAYNLLTICLGLATLIFGIVNSGLLQKTANVFLSITGGGISISLILLSFVLKSRYYSALGTMPHTWLLKEYIQENPISTPDSNISNNDNKALGYVLSYILYNYNSILVSSHKSNDNRIALLDWAILVLSLSFVPIVLNFLLPPIFSFLV